MRASRRARKRAGGRETSSSLMRPFFACSTTNERKKMVSKPCSTSHFRFSLLLQFVFFLPSGQRLHLFLSTMPTAPSLFEQLNAALASGEAEDAIKGVKVRGEKERRRNQKKASMSRRWAAEKQISMHRTCFPLRFSLLLLFCSSASSAGRVSTSQLTRMSEGERTKRSGRAQTRDEHRTFLFFFFVSSSST